MENFSDSTRFELDSDGPMNSLQLITSESQLHNLSALDISSSKLSKRITLLELENEHLRIDLENIRMELEAKIAANQNLKDKITELYTEAQDKLQETQKLQNALKDSNGCLATTENSSKWYQAQVHDLQANKETLQLEIDMYREIARRRQQIMLGLITKCKQLNTDYAKLVDTFKQEKRNLQDEIERLQLKNSSCSPISRTLDVVSTYPSSDLSTTKLEVMEEFQDTKKELKTMERLILCEVAKISVQNVLNKHRMLITSMEEDLQKCKAEKNDMAAQLDEARREIQEFKFENDTLHSTLLTSKQEQNQLQQAIVQLRFQLTKMIVQHKFLKSKNSTLEKLTSMREVQNENKRLKSFLLTANGCLFKKLTKYRVKYLKSYQKQRRKLNNTKNETEAAVRECLKYALERNKELKSQLKSIAVTKVSEDSIDEGYEGSSMLGNMLMDHTLIRSPPPLNAVLLQSISKILSDSKDILAPVQLGLNKLSLKIERFQEEQYLQTIQQVLPSSHYDTRQIAVEPSQNNTRSVA